MEVSSRRRSSERRLAKRARGFGTGVCLAFARFRGITGRRRPLTPTMVRRKALCRTALIVRALRESPVNVSR
jgi:hypothetical protein